MTGQQKRKKRNSRLKFQNENWERRIALILLVFNIFLFMKGVSATYTASFLSLNRPDLVELYMVKFQTIPLFYFITILFFSISLFIENKKVIKLFDSLGLLSLIIVTSYLFLI